MIADFTPDADGLRNALDRLVAARRAPGAPHPSERPVPSPLMLDEGVGGEAALTALADLALDHPARLDHRGFLAHMDPPTPWFTWAAAQWAAATNQNLLHPDVAPQIRILERTVAAELAAIFGMGGGHLVPGSTVANLTALWAAREVAGISEVVSSEAAHLSVAKAAHVLGLHHRTVGVDEEQRLRGDQLGDLSRAALVLTAGTVAAGAVDDLTLTAPSDERARWVHVDAAWAGPMRFHPTLRSVLDGIDAADSVGFSAHKWLHQPKDSAAILFADPDAAHSAITFGGSYLGAGNVGLLGSSGARALPLAVTMMAWGRTGIAEVIDAGLAPLQRLHALVEADPLFESFAPPTTGVLLWRPVAAASDLDDVRHRLDDAWVSTAEVGGRRWLRSVAVNPMADADHVLAAVRRAIDAGE